MSTVLSVYNSEGCVGRCDAKCHEAEQPACVCVCKGAFHGKGLKYAQTFSDALEQEFAENLTSDISTSCEVYQGLLFNI